MSDKEIFTSKEKAELAVKLLINYIGEDPDGEHTKDTPKRVVKSYAELFSGYKKTAEEALGTVFTNDGYDQMVILKDIEFYSTCAHHMIPFVGKCHIGYIPGEKVVGLSKLARVTEVFARRLQLQERLTKDIADSIDKVLSPKGVMVVMQAKHFCVCSRGIGKQNSSMVTSAIKGAFQEPSARDEFLKLIKE